MAFLGGFVWDLDFFYTAETAVLPLCGFGSLRELLLGRRCIRALGLGPRSGGKERTPRPNRVGRYNYRFAFIFWHSRAALTAEDCRYPKFGSWAF